MLNGKTILVTGGTGSFGRRFVATVLERYKPRKLIVFSRDELKQYDMSQAFSDECMRYFIGDVRDLARLTQALDGVNYSCTRPRLSRSPLLDYNPTECIKTNVHGAENVISPSSFP